MACLAWAQLDTAPDSPRAGRPARSTRAKPVGGELHALARITRCGLKAALRGQQRC